jgi:putative flippase GtrA
MPTSVRENIDQQQRLSAPAKFLISGALNTAATYVLFLFLIRFFGASAAYTLTYAIGIVIAYFLNTFFVFRTGHSKRMVFAVPVSYLIQYFYGLAALNTLIQIFRLPGNIAMAIVIASSFPLQFLILRFAARGSIIQRREQ